MCVELPYWSTIPYVLHCTTNYPLLSLTPYSSYRSTQKCTTTINFTAVYLLYSTAPYRSIAPPNSGIFLMSYLFFFFSFFFFSSQQFWVKQWVSSYWNGIVVTMHGTYSTVLVQLSSGKDGDMVSLGL